MSLISNKKARFNYEILEEFEAGMELLGHEVKSLRKGRGTLDGAHVIVRGGEGFVVGMTIPPYQPGNKSVVDGYDPARTRRLLLGKKELARLAEFESQKGLTIVPLSVYNKGRHIKLSIAAARGKKLFDKRESLKKKDAEREVRRSLKTR